MKKHRGTFGERSRKHLGSCWLEQDEELERYCRTPRLRYGGNLGNGNHWHSHPTLEYLERRLG